MDPFDLGMVFLGDVVCKLWLYLVDIPTVIPVVVPCVLLYESSTVFMVLLCSRSTIGCDSEFVEEKEFVDTAGPNQCGFEETESICGSQQRRNQVVDSDDSSQRKRILPGTITDSSIIGDSSVIVDSSVAAASG